VRLTSGLRFLNVLPPTLKTRRGDAEPEFSGRLVRHRRIILWN
jgi:hypothetical protein